MKSLKRIATIGKRSPGVLLRVPRRCTNGREEVFHCCFIAFEQLLIQVTWIPVDHYAAKIEDCDPILCHRGYILARRCFCLYHTKSPGGGGRIALQQHLHQRLIRVHERVVADESATVLAGDCAPAFADSDADGPTEIDAIPVYRRVEICADTRSDVHDCPPRTFSRNFSSICSFVVKLHKTIQLTSSFELVAP